MESKGATGEGGGGGGGSPLGVGGPLGGGVFWESPVNGCIGIPFWEINYISTWSIRSTCLSV